MESPGWWESHGESLRRDMLRFFKNAGDHELCRYGDYQPHERLLNTALSPASIAFKLKDRVRLDQFISFCESRDVRAGASTIFRAHFQQWDDQRWDGMVNTYNLALEHAQSIVRGDAMSNGRRHDALIYGAALLCITDPINPSCEVLVRLSQPGSPNGLHLNELRLGTRLERAIEEDAARLREIFGAAAAAGRGVSLQYACMADWGDTGLSAKGSVVGYYDAVLDALDGTSSMLEIKATRGVQCTHAAQVLTYSDMYVDGPLAKALLWDTRGRRVFVWNLDPSRHGEFARECITCYLENGNGNIPGISGRVRPQTVCLDRALLTRS